MTPAARFLVALAEPAECWPLSAALADAGFDRPLPATPPPVVVLEEHTVCRVRTHGAPGVLAGATTAEVAAAAEAAGLRVVAGPDRVRVTPADAWLDAPVSFRWRACPSAARGAERVWTAQSAEACLLEQLPCRVSGRMWFGGVDPEVPAAGWGDTTLLDGLLRVYAAAGWVPLVVQLSGVPAERPSCTLHTSLRSAASWP